MIVSSTLERRVEALESASGGGGCERCRGVLVVVSDAMTGEFRSARRRGEDLTEAEYHELRAETRCPKCGTRIDLDAAPVIMVGGLRGRS
jgi:hypothetical protein